MFILENQMKVELLICPMNRKFEFINPKVIGLFPSICILWGRGDLFIGHR